MGSLKRGAQTLRRQFSSSLRAARVELKRCRKSGDWAGVLSAARQLLRDDPSQAGVQLQLAEALLALGQVDQAEAAFKDAISARPTYPHAGLRYGMFLARQGRQPEAVAIISNQLARSPWDRALKQGLFEVGGRSALPTALYAQPQAEAIRGREALKQAATALNHWVDARAFALDDYDAFRRENPIEAPEVSNHDALRIVVDATSCDETDLRRTLISLLDQTDGQWKAYVRASEALKAHPVSSYARADERIQLVDELPAGAGLVLMGGTVLDPATVAWFVHAASLAGDADIVCDHDHYDTDWKSDLVRTQPVLRGMISALDERTPVAAAAYVKDAAKAGVTSLLAEVTTSEATAHLPRILASVPSAKPTPIKTPERSGHTLWPSPQAVTIRVVIPTKDRADILRNCVQSMMALANRPERLFFTVLDNNSSEAETATLLAEIAAEDGNRVIANDTPFNWSLLNNLGAEGASEDILVFANNDLQMLTPGWDEVLVRRMNDSRVGIVGARLLFENRTIQHVGIALGSGSGRPSHEAVGALSSEGGPLDRWIRTREVAAVTGAFMAVRAEIFGAVGGFSTRYAIAYNDIDFCLKVRESSLAVVMAGDLEMLHFESATRGFNDTPAKVRWDDDELRDLYARWGKDLLRDPSRNPQWHGTERNIFESWRDLSKAEVEDWLKRSASGRGWMASRKA